MEFEDMQAIWNEQSSEKLYAIDEAALEKLIGKKSRSVHIQVQFVEWVLILTNLFLGIKSLYDTILGDAPIFFFFMGIAYLLVALFGIYKRVMRKREETDFDDSILGEVDKALYRQNYMIREGGKLVPYYIAPLLIIISIFFVYSGFYWGAVGALGLLALVHYGVKWEMRKLHSPRRESLESVREALLADPEQ